MDDRDREVGTINWTWFGILAGVVIMAGTATYFLLPLFLPTNDRNVTIIKADPEPFKIQPADEGGKTVDHQNLMVVDILKGEKARQKQAETLRPGAASPEPPALAVDMLDDNAITVPTTAGDTTASAAEKQDDKTKFDTAAVDTIQKTASTAKPSPKPVAPTILFQRQSRWLPQTSFWHYKRVVVIEGDAPLYDQLAAPGIKTKPWKLPEYLPKSIKSTKSWQLKRCERYRYQWRVSPCCREPLPRDAADQLCAMLRRAGQDLL